MSQVTALCANSDDNGELPNNTAAAPSLPLSRKRPHNKAFSDAHPRNDSGPLKKTATGSAEFVVDLELADEVEVVLPHKKRRGVVRRNTSIENNAARKCAQILKGVEFTEKVIGSEDAQEADHRESHEGIAAAASHPVNSDSERTSRDDWSANKHSLTVPNSKPPPNASGRQRGFCAWEDRLSELADYRRIQGHCNVPSRYSDNIQLAYWVNTQRKQYKLHLEGKASHMTLSRFKELERLGFEWDSHAAAWESHLSELTDYCREYGHCNVPENYSENTKLGRWVKNQRMQYRLQLEGKPSNMPPFRIQELESLGFGWKPFIGRTKGSPKKPSLDEDATCVRETVAEAPMQQRSLKKSLETYTAIKSTLLPNPKNPTGKAKSTSTSSRGEPQKIQRAEAGDALFDETDLDGSPSLDLAAKPSPYIDRQAAKLLSPDTSAPADDSVEASTRDDAPHTNLPWPAHKQKSFNSFSHAMSIAAPPESDVLVAAAKKLANSRQCAESQLETAPSKEIIMANPVVAESLRQRHNLFAHALLLGDGDGPTGNDVQVTPDKPANAKPDMQQTPPDEVFQSDIVLNEVELELNWLGEESMYCLSFPEFQFDFVYEYASPALKVELRKLSRDDQSEADKLKHIVRMHDWLISRRFDFVRNYIRKMLGQGFRRQRMRTVIAELRLLRRQQSELHFPAMILERSETAPAKAMASTMIEQVDVNTLKVVATFRSQIEAERQTGIPRTHISRGLHQGRPLGGYFWRSVRLQSS